MKTTDKDRLDWLSSCEKLDHSGFDSGYSFERIIMTDDVIGVSDVRIAIRGYAGVDSLRKAVDQAMAVDRLLDKNGNKSP